MNTNMCRARYVLDKTKWQVHSIIIYLRKMRCLNDKYIHENFLRLSAMSWLSHKAMVQRPAISIIRINVYSDRKPKVCQWVSQSVWQVFLLLVCRVIGVENAVQHTSLPPQTRFWAANSKKSSSNCWQAFICHSLMWSHRRILVFTVTICNKVFSGNQHYKRGVHSQHFRVRLFRQERVTYHTRNNELERMCKELLCLTVCNYYSIASRDSVQPQKKTKQLVSHWYTRFKPGTSWGRSRNAMQTRHKYM